MTNPISQALQQNKKKRTRLDRRRSALGKHIHGQTRITAYFPILNKIEIALKANQELINCLEARCKELSLQIESDNGKVNVSFLLKMLMETAVKNSVRKNHGQRYDENAKLFAAYLFIVGGRALYEMLLANLRDSLPSLTEVGRILNRNSTPVFEGVFRFNELKDFLIAHNLPHKICVSEDGTRIQVKFLFDPASNQIVGPVLPLSGNGIPISGSFPATSAAMIAKHMKHGEGASIGYAIMAQPLQKGAPSFCLALFGTNNCFTAEHCSRRWNFISDELAKIGIEVVGYSSDGDPKLISAMHSHMFSPNGDVALEDWKDWHNASTGQKFLVIQDAIHTANKFKTRLNPSTHLAIGDFTASQTHLRQLIKTQPKEKHGLTEHDLDKEDKMNFNASMKISNEKVTTLMKETVPGSEATVAYLTIMRYMIEACLDENLSPLEIIYKIWNCVFFLRYWKLWLLNHRAYSMENFVTANLHMSVEIIAHSLICLIIKFREEKSPELFLVALFSSQACESFFRLARSMTTTESTVINFTMREFLSKVRRVDLLHYITSKMSGKLVFPREKRKKLLGILTQEKLQTNYLPTNSEISAIVMSAKADALSVLNSLGVKYSAGTSLARINSHLVNCKNFNDQTDATATAPSTYQSDITDDDIPLDILIAFPSPEGISSLEPESLCEPDALLPPNSIFVMVRNSSGDFVRMRKSTFCWLLSSYGSKLSSDRLERVREGICFSYASLNLWSKVPFLNPGFKEEVEVGQWCIFKKKTKFCVGQLLGFSYLSGSGAARSYTLQKAPTKPPEDSKKVRGLGCLCAWFKHNVNGILTVDRSKAQVYCNMTEYVGTIPAPALLNSRLSLSQSALTFLNKL